jgi:hypothetical protein
MATITPWCNEMAAVQHDGKSKSPNDVTLLV